MNENIVSLLSLASIGAILILLFWFYRDYRVDSFRQEMFKLRDGFFDEARSGALDFEAPAYGMIRITMNGLIRFGHRLSLTNMIFMIFVMRKNKNSLSSSFSKRLNDHLGSMDEESRSLVLKYHWKMNLLLMRHLILSSPIFVVTLLVPISIMFFANRILKTMLQKLKEPIDNIDSLAYSEGDF